MRRMLVALALVAIAAPTFAQEIDTAAISAAQLGDPPVTAGDIADRPYTVIGPITASVRKATLVSGASSPAKIYRELWERGRKMGADAVIHASYGKSHITGFSWGPTTATGVAIKFK